MRIARVDPRFLPEGAKERAGHLPRQHGGRRLPLSRRFPPFLARNLDTEELHERLHVHGSATRLEKERHDLCGKPWQFRRRMRDGREAAPRKREVKRECSPTCKHGHGAFARACVFEDLRGNFPGREFLGRTHDRQ